MGNVSKKGPNNNYSLDVSESLENAIQKELNIKKRKKEEK